MSCSPEAFHHVLCQVQGRVKSASTELAHVAGKMLEMHPSEATLLINPFAQEQAAFEELCDAVQAAINSLQSVIRSKAS